MYKTHLLFNNERSIDLNDECSSVGLNRDDREDDDRGLAAQQTAAGYMYEHHADMTDTQQSAE